MTPPGVVLNFADRLGTGGGSLAQDLRELEFLNGDEDPDRCPAG